MKSTFYYDILVLFHTETGSIEICGHDIIVCSCCSLSPNGFQKTLKTSTSKTVSRVFHLHNNRLRRELNVHMSVLSLKQTDLRRPTGSHIHPNSGIVSKKWREIDTLLLHTTNRKYKNLSYRRVTARCVLSVVILPIAAQQCRNYLYDKS